MHLPSMRRLQQEAMVGLTAWSLMGMCASVPVPAQLAHRACSKSYSDLGSQLSADAEIYTPGSAEFAAVTARWSSLDTPNVTIAVLPATEADVVATVRYANQQGVPFAAFSGMHGSITTLGRLQNGIEIYLTKLNTIDVSADGTTATIGGGTIAVNVTNALWAAGKQTVTGTCECVSLLGPGLGGGHGWLQGHHGLVSDQWLSANMVLANGTLATLDTTSDLWWAVKGAGHNFGIVTSLTTKIYDIQSPNWAIETIIFSGDKVGAVYQAANDVLLRNGTQAADVVNWSYWYNDPTTDAEKPVIAMYIMQEGVDAVDAAYTQAFHALGPLSVTAQNGTYLDLGAWTGISLADAPCGKTGKANNRFPIYLESYNATAQAEVYSVFANATAGAGSPFSGSLFMFEGYSNLGVRAVDASAGAFAFRGDNLLIAPLMTYDVGNATVEAEAVAVGSRIRDILREGSGRDELHVYLNYAFGDETTENWYGYEAWRQDKLKALKSEYDPEGKFSFYGPIA